MTQPSKMAIITPAIKTLKELARPESIRDGVRG